MKNPIFTFSLIIAFSISVVFISSCKKDEDNTESTTNMLVGTWSMDETELDITVGGVDIVDHLVDEFNYERDSAQAQMDFAEAFISWENEGTVDFKSDKSYHLTFDNNDQDEEDGTWSVTDNGNTLRLVNGNETDDIKILSISSTAAQFGLPDETEEADLDDDGVNESTLLIKSKLRLNK